MAVDGSATGSANSSRVRTAAAAIERPKRGRMDFGDQGGRSRSRGPDKDVRDAGENSNLVFDVASNSMVAKDSLPEDRPATKSLL